MSVHAAPMRPRAKPRLRWAVTSGAVIVLVAAMAYSTKVVRLDATSGPQAGVFTPAEYGRAEFPKVQAAIVARAVDAATVAKDPAAAAKQYGVSTDAGPEIPVRFTGVVGQGDSGVYDVKVDGLPSTLTVRVQTGPAIMGTDLRDSTGTISFGQFTNQIDYQNAGSALNREMKKQVLSKLDPEKLTGKTVSVVGVFQLTTPDTWVVTPVQMSVQ